MNYLTQRSVYYYFLMREAAETGLDSWSFIAKNFGVKPKEIKTYEAMLKNPVLDELSAPCDIEMYKNYLNGFCTANSEFGKRECEREIIDVKALDTLKQKAINGGAPLGVPVQFLLDEFPTLQADKIYPTIFSVGRGLNIFITAIVQDYTQLETSYSGGVAQQIRNNCNLTYFLGTNDINTAKAVKEQIGRHIIPDPAQYLQGGIKFIEEYVVSEDELMHRVKPGDAYITINNHMPLKGCFELYFDCPEYTQFPQAENYRKPSIDFKDPKYRYDSSWMVKRTRSLWD